MVLQVLHYNVNSDDVFFADAAADAWKKALIRKQFRVKVDVACLLLWGEGIELAYPRNIQNEMYWNICFFM